MRLRPVDSHSRKVPMSAQSCPMRRTSGISETPAAVRQERPGWFDARLWLGVLLVVASTVVGAKVLAGSSEQVEVWQVTRDLAAGAPVDEADVVAVAVESSVANLGYTSANIPPVGVLTRPITTGELLPSAALGEAPAMAMRQVTIPIEAGHFPPNLSAGEIVDMWVTPDVAEGTARPQLTLGSVLVSSVSTDGQGFAGQGSVVVHVPEESVSEVVNAIRGGVVDLVSVPVASQVLAAEGDLS